MSVVALLRLLAACMGFAVVADLFVTFVPGSPLRSTLSALLVGGALFYCLYMYMEFAPRGGLASLVRRRGRIERADVSEIQ